MSATAPIRRGRSRPSWSWSADGAIAVLGNHDGAIGNPRDHMQHRTREIVIEWTRGQLGIEERQIPRRSAADASATTTASTCTPTPAPRRWNYITDAVEEAARSMMRHRAQRVTFCGHVHKPAIYGAVGHGEDDVVHAGHRRARAAARLAALACGARLGRPAARRRFPPRLTPCSTPPRAKSPSSRVPYDIEARSRGHPAQRPAAWFAERLFRGQVTDRMVKPRLEQGSTVDGFLIEELIHKGGMARLWRVSKPG